MTTPNALSADSLASYINSSLPKDASPQLKTPSEAIAIACHAGMLAVGFRLVGLGEDHTIEAHASADDARALPREWNSSSTQSFRYKHSQSSMEYLLKASRLGNKTIVNAIAMGDDKPVDFHLTTGDFTSTSAFPATPASSESVEDSKHAITSLFISPTRLADLGSDLRVNVIQRLIPGLQKEGYEESSAGTTTSSRQSGRRGDAGRDAEPERQPPAYDPLRHEPPPARPHPLADPSIMPRRPPVPAGDFPPPDFEDEYELQRPSRGYRPGGGLGMPGYGERDLYPPGLGPNDPLRAGGGPGLRGGPGGGMHPTFDDPMFGDRGDPGGYDPQAPPGARYDPTGPGDGRPFGAAGRRPGGGGGGGGFGAPHNPFSGFGSGDFI